VEIIAKYIHGSEDSLDIDTYYIVDKVPSFQESKVFCDSIKDENANLLELDESGHVCACYKGTPDECNNSLFMTYGLHEQTYPLLIKSMFERDKWLKTLRAVRIILSHLSRTQYRKAVKAALKGTMIERIQLLKTIDLKDIDFDSLEHNQSGKDVMKIIAFQAGQTLGLLDGHEYYTKSAVAAAYPGLKQFLYREDNPDMSVLNTYVRMLMDKIIPEIIKENEDYVTLHDEMHTYNMRTEKLIK